MLAQQLRIVGGLDKTVWLLKPVALQTCGMK
jgi:hypothetical protein